jgi:VWA domain-containing protein
MDERRKPYWNRLLGSIQAWASRNTKTAVLPNEFVQSVMAPARAIVFVIECSNAMAGEPLRAAIAACRQLVERLQQGQRFNLVAFGSGTLLFDEQLHPASSRTISLAGAFLGLLDVMGKNAVRHALRRARHQVRERADIVLIGMGDGSPLHEEIRAARELAVKFHCIDYSGVANSSRRHLAERTEGHFLALPAPMNTRPIPPESLPSKYACYGTALIRRQRPPVPFHPDTLATALQRYRQSGPGGEAPAAPFNWADIPLPPKLIAGLATLRERGIAELEMVTGLLEALGGLSRTGGMLGPAWDRADDKSADPDISLELRILAMASYREWCLQDVIFNPSYDLEDVPEFLRSG